MRFDRLALATVALCASGLIASCGGDDNLSPSIDSTDKSPAVVDSVLVEDTTPGVAPEPVGGPANP
jgi:hypothetical protein